MVTPPNKKPRSIHRRIHADSCDLIDRAAQESRKNHSEFMIDAARREAEAVLLDQQLFLLDEADFAAFEAALDAPPAANPQLQKLLTTPAPWE